MIFGNRREGNTLKAKVGTPLVLTIDKTDALVVSSVFQYESPFRFFEGFTHLLSKK